MQADELITHAIAVSSPLPDGRVELVAGLTRIRLLRSALDAIELAHVTALAGVSPTLEGDIADAHRVNLGNANRIAKRAKTAAQLPEFAAALAAGHITAAHIDVIADVIRREEPATRQELIARSAELAATASRLTVSEFRGAATEVARQISLDNGTTRADRQRGDTRCRTRTDPVTGMWELTARFGPELAVRIKQQLDAALERRYAAVHPSSTPSDPVAKQDHLRGLALYDLVLGRDIDEDLEAGFESDAADTMPAADTGDVTSGGPAAGASGIEPRRNDEAAPSASARGPLPRVRTRPGPPEVLALWDVDKPLTQVDWGLDVDIPPQVFADLLARADVRIHTYLLRNGVVVDAPGQLDLGRAQRLANRAQRRALRAMYRTCAIPGCGVPFERCKMHHVIWWEHGGLTDLVNLLPICPHHHERVHTLLWQLTLTHDRTLYVHDEHGAQLYRPSGPNRTRPAAGNAKGNSSTATGPSTTAPEGAGGDRDESTEPPTADTG